MVLLSTFQVAEMLCDAFGTPSIDGKKVLALTRAGALTDVGPGRSVRVELPEVEDFIERTRFVTREEWPDGWSLFRVSLLDLREDEVRDEQGAVLRTHLGADYAGESGLSPRMLDLAWHGMWEVGDEAVRRALSGKTLLLGTTKGYIHPAYVRCIVGARRVGSQVVWETDESPREIQDFVGTGLWMPVKQGRVSDWA
jgi:hypothetical protein